MGKSEKTLRPDLPYHSMEQVRKHTTLGSNFLLNFHNDTNKNYSSELLIYCSPQELRNQNLPQPLHGLNRVAQRNGIECVKCLKQFRGKFPQRMRNLLRVRILQSSSERRGGWLMSKQKTVTSFEAATVV